MTDVNYAGEVLDLEKRWCERLGRSRENSSGSANRISIDHARIGGHGRGFQGAVQNELGGRVRGGAGQG